MQFLSNSFIGLFGFLLFVAGTDTRPTCQKAISYKTDDFAVAQTINLCFQDNVPDNFEVNLDIPVCDDKLCAPLFLKIKWDLAGHYLEFDTLPGHPLTKFDHKRFSEADYQKLNQILNDKNSILRALAKNDLVDQSIKVKATTVDAVTGATPATIKNAVIEGAVYSSYTLWHWVNGPVGDSLRAFTLKNYSDEIAFKLLASTNFETQLFALKRFTAPEYDRHFNRLLPVIEKSSPIVRAYVVGKLPLPFPDKARNKSLVQLIATLDNYSKSMFIAQITSEKELALEFVPLVLAQFAAFDEKQQEKFVSGAQKLGITKINQQIKEYFTSLN
jgi:hypothetical protein